MPYYHVYIEYVDKTGKEKNLMHYDLPEEYVRNKIASAFMENRPFLCLGIVIHPSAVNRIAIFESENKFGELILPNGRSPVSDMVDHHYVVYCFYNSMVKGVVPCTDWFIISPPEEKGEPTKIPTEFLSEKETLSELTTGLMDSASFLGLDTNWSLATCALQLQEVAVTLVAKRKNIKLDKANVERLLNKKIESLSFNDQYEAFSKQVRDLFDVEMPILTTHLRKMRAKVLHEGYNPKPEETEPIVSFTIGLLKKLKDIS